MAPGYVVALAFEAAGLAGLVIGLIRLRAESRVRGAELRGLLLTGHATASASARQAGNGNAPPRVIVEASSVGQTVQDSATAREALQRAIVSLRQIERKAA